jgi:DNA-directed RNA polymerase specialized sigma subunit
VMSRDEVAAALQVRPHVVQRSQRSAIKKLRETLGSSAGALVELSSDTD